MSDEPFPELTFRPYEPGDEVAILESFNRIFASVDPNFTPRTLDFWRWQFLGNPSGTRNYLALDDEGHVVGHNGGICQRIDTPWGRKLFLQAVDNFSDPARLTGLKRFSLLHAVGHHMAPWMLGDGPDKIAVTWGLPIPPAWRVGKVFLKYELVRTQLKLRAEPDEVTRYAAPGVSVEEVNEFPEEVFDLYQHCAKDHEVIAVRDKAQLDWRYAHHPERTYQIALARRDGILVGYAVYVQGDFDHEKGEGLLCDWLVPPTEDGAAVALRNWLVDRARADGAPRITVVIPDTIKEWVDFQKVGFRAAPTTYFIVGRNQVKRLRPRYLYTHWYYTLGETDLV